jgi:hypothetical protein
MGGAGNDSIDGQAGLDTAQYAANRSSYVVQATASGYSVKANIGSDGTDSLAQIERLRFADVSTALDMKPNEAGGQTALLLGAVLGNTAIDTQRDLVGTLLGLFDQGFGMQDLAASVMRLSIWGLLANGGQASASNEQIARYLLTTVNGSAPDAATLGAAVQTLNTGPEGQFLAQLALSNANQTQVQLVGRAQVGMDFTPG